ncbi:TetR/AcrR family transcriptional regulator [Rathayibacter sp. YIM 133350]|uniref:TetR/AcrR family transcriptional regulator n=1 Tax=Rathayibacter sp. YIM 133350 TaxID=3131992 RepID=UPI00307DDF5E
MPRLTDASRKQRREAIAAAAMRCFARDGFANTSMADIISETGSSAGSVYSNFANKAELVRFAASGALDSMVAAVSEALPEKRTPATVLSGLLRSNSDRAHARTLLQIWAEMPRDPALEEIAGQSLLELRELVRTALRSWSQHPSRSGAADLETITDAVLTATQGYLVRISIDNDVDPTVLADGAVAVFERF